MTLLLNSPKIQLLASISLAQDKAFAFLELFFI